MLLISDGIAPITLRERYDPGCNAKHRWATGLLGLTMIYTHSNTANGVSVYDVATKEKLRRVLSIDTDTGEIERCHEPVRMNAAGDKVETFKVKFDAIYAISGMEPLPVLFHCYGRQ